MKDNTGNIIRIIVLFALLLLPVFYALFGAIDLEYSWLKKFAYLAVVGILLLLPALFLKARTYFMVEGVFNFFFFPIDIASLYLNKQPTSTAFLNNIFATNFSEAWELLVAAWPVALVVIVLWVTYFYLALKVENNYLFARKVAKYIVLLAVGTGIVGVLSMMVLRSSGNKDRSTADAAIDIADHLWMKLYKIYPYNLYLETADLIHDKYVQRQLSKQLSSFRFGITPAAHEAPEMYILIIGEAARYDHFGINGYARNTTPLLELEENLISFDSAFAQANLTATSVPLIVTRATAGNPQIAYAEKTITDAFSEAGFKTGWITKQIPYSYVERAMTDCNYSHFYAKGIDVNSNYDEEMLIQLKEYTEDTTQFFVLHSLGCHFRYEMRYPDEYKRFLPVFEEMFSYSMISEENKDKLVNAYDNAILYTDFFLHEIIRYADSLNRPACVVYMSDHGESFWDDERKLSLHGSYQVSEFEYHVPLFVWHSEEYALKYPEKVTALIQNKSIPVSSDVVFYSLLDLASIKGDVLDSTRSICSPYLQGIDTIDIITGAGEVKPYCFSKKNIVIH